MTATTISLPFLVAGLVIVGGRVPSESSGRSPQSTVLLQDGAIAGRIMDGGGGPLVDARVMALKRGPLMPGGSRPLFAWAESRTNARGEFRIVGLPPGEYFVYAIPPRAAQFGTSNTVPVVLAPTFFPGTIDESRAQPLTLAADETATDIGFRLVAVRAYRVSGVVVDETGAAVREAFVALEFGPGAHAYWVTTKGPGFVADAGEAQSDQDGAFVIGSVTSGSYIVRASLRGGALGRVPITVDQTDVTDVRIVVQRPR